MQHGLYQFACLKQNNLPLPNRVIQLTLVVFVVLELLSTKMPVGIRMENLGPKNRTMTDSTIDYITSDFTHEIALEMGVIVRQGNHSTIFNPDFLSHCYTHSAASFF